MTYVYIVWCIPKNKHYKDKHISFKVGIYTTVKEAKNAAQAQICTYKIDGVYWHSTIKTKKLKKNEKLYKNKFSTWVDKNKNGDGKIITI